MSDDIIVIEHLVKQFKALRAVDDVSLRVGRGKVLVIIGPSGSGKSTVLRCINHLETPTSGQIIIGGEDMAFTPPNKRPTNMVFQSYAVFPHMTVEQNVGYGLKVTGVAADEIKRIEGLSVVDRRYQGGDVLEEIGNAIEIARLKKSKDEGKLLDRFKEASTWVVSRQ